MSGHLTNIELMRCLLTSWSDPDPETFVALFTPEGEFEDVPYAIRLRGHSELRAHARRVKKHNVDLHIEIDNCDATATTGVAEWRLSHTYVGNFEGVDCTGNPLNIRGLSIYRFLDGRIARATDYWNYVEIIRALGILPRDMRALRTT